MTVARPIGDYVASTVGRAISLGATNSAAGAAARTFELTSGTRQLLFGALDNEIVIRFITASQVEPVGSYLYDVRLPAVDYRQVVPVPSDATAFSVKRGPDVTGTVPISWTEHVQAAPTLRGGDLTTDIDTLASAAVAVDAYQGSVTPAAADTGRILGGWYTRNILTNPADMTAWSLAGTGSSVAASSSVDGYTAWLCDQGSTAGDTIYSTGTVADGERVLVSMKVRAETSVDIGKEFCIKMVKGAGAGATAAIKCFVPVTMAWQEIYIDFQLEAGDTNFILSLRRDSSSTVYTAYIAEPQVELVEGFTTILPSPYYGDNADHWSEYHPGCSMINMNSFWTGSYTSRGLVVRSPVQRAIGTIDHYRKPHLAGVPNIGARA